MIPAPLFDHRGSVWRYLETRGAALREVTREWSKVAGSERAGFILKANFEARGDTGGGERTTGEYEGACNASVDVRAGDVVEVYSGRMAPLNLKVEEDDAPGNRTRALVMVPFVGELSS